VSFILPSVKYLKAWCFESITDWPSTNVTRVQGLLFQPKGIILIIIKAKKKPMYYKFKFNGIYRAPDNLGDYQQFY